MNIRELLKDERVYLVASTIRGPDCPLRGGLPLFSMILKYVITGRVRAFLGADRNVGYEVNTTPITENHCKRLLDRAHEYTQGLRAAEDAWFNHYVEHLYDGLVALRSLLEATEEEEKELALMIDVMAKIKKMSNRPYQQG